MLVSVNRGKFNKEDGSVTSQTEGLLSELFFLINPLINNAIDRKIIHSLHNTDIYLIQEAVDFFSRNTVFCHSWGLSVTTVFPLVKIASFNHGGP